MLLKYSYYDHLLAISINRGNFKKAKANIDILKTYKEALSLEDQIHLEFNELTVLFYSKEMTDIRQKQENLSIIYLKKNIILPQRKERKSCGSASHQVSNMTYGIDRITEHFKIL